MYLDKHDILRLREVISKPSIEEFFTDNLYLIYRDKEGEINVAFGEEEIEDAVSSD